MDIGFPLHSHILGSVTMKLDRILYRIHRYISWILVPFMIVVVVSGYAYTRDLTFLHRGYAYYLHETFDLPLFILLIAHVMLAARFELKRFKIKGQITDILLLVISVILATAVILADQGFFR
jgi:hypothetical protein